MVLHIVVRHGILFIDDFARRDRRVCGTQNLLGGAVEHREFDCPVALGVDVHRGAADVVAAVILGLDWTRAQIWG